MQHTKHHCVQHVLATKNSTWTAGPTAYTIHTHIGSTMSNTTSVATDTPPSILVNHAWVVNTHGCCVFDQHVLSMDEGGDETAEVCACKGIRRTSSMPLLSSCMHSSTARPSSTACPSSTASSCLRCASPHDAVSCISCIALACWCLCALGWVSMGGGHACFWLRCIGSACVWVLKYAVTGVDASVCAGTLPPVTMVLPRGCVLCVGCCCCCCWVLFVHEGCA